MAKRLRIELGEIKTNLRLFDSRANDALDKIFTFQEERSTAFMKVNAPWTDDTTNARSSLQAKSYSETNSHLLVLAHGVFYGIYLETIKNGKYGIVVPAWREASNDIWRMIRNLFAMMEGG